MRGDNITRKDSYDTFNQDLKPTTTTLKLMEEIFMINQLMT